jgi:hypothetical protein
MHVVSVWPGGGGNEVLLSGHQNLASKGLRFLGYAWLKPHRALPICGHSQKFGERIGRPQIAQDLAKYELCYIVCTRASQNIGAKPNGSRGSWACQIFGLARVGSKPNTPLLRDINWSIE